MLCAKSYKIKKKYIGLPLAMAAAAAAAEAAGLTKVTS